MRLSQIVSRTMWVFTWREEFTEITFMTRASEKSISQLQFLFSLSLSFCLFSFDMVFPSKGVLDGWNRNCCRIGYDNHSGLAAISVQRFVCWWFIGRSATKWYARPCKTVFETFVLSQFYCLSHAKCERWLITLSCSSFTICEYETADIEILWKKTRDVCICCRTWPEK